jgi:hypothetical protein
LLRFISTPLFAFEHDIALAVSTLKGTVTANSTRFNLKNIVSLRETSVYNAVHGAGINSKEYAMSAKFEHVGAAESIAPSRFYGAAFAALQHLTHTPARDKKARRATRRNAPGVSKTSPFAGEETLAISAIRSLFSRCHREGVSSRGAFQQLQGNSGRANKGLPLTRDIKSGSFREYSKTDRNDALSCRQAPFTPGLPYRASPIRYSTERPD